ncbi:electron transport flavoprotein subunit beta [Rhizobium grahamii CCGE 502]|uniref:Electron transport flavoprotein subunit beta n=1 Tax=Rhizobium grahamii CCGE 502 TaxID=990285 RepID=S3HBX7_9HYPH|nr:electron transport flavoprotein subunit beta [Rhizobium grahamii CCGE 502]
MVVSIGPAKAEETQAIDADSNQTGQMLAALLGPARATFALKIEIGDGKATVTREVDGGCRPSTSSFLPSSPQTSRAVPRCRTS